MNRLQRNVTAAIAMAGRPRSQSSRMRRVTGSSNLGPEAEKATQAHLRTLLPVAVQGVDTWFRESATHSRIVEIGTGGQSIEYTFQFDGSELAMARTTARFGYEAPSEDAPTVVWCLAEFVEDGFVVGLYRSDEDTTASYATGSYRQFSYEDPELFNQLGDMLRVYREIASLHNLAAHVNSRIQGHNWLPGTEPGITAALGHLRSALELVPYPSKSAEIMGMDDEWTAERCPGGG